MSRKVAVLVVDDSAICRELICEALRKDPDIEIVGTCENGQEAILKTRELKPAVITMDVEMPVLDGLGATEAIMAEFPTPILMLTADPRQQAPELTCRALELGALALQVKPALDAGPEAWNLAREVKLLSTVKVIRHLRRKSGPPTGKTGSHAVPAGLLNEALPGAAFGSSIGVVAIGSSTGGPQVLQKLLGGLPADFPAAVLIVQHINGAFAESLAGWLASSSRVAVRLAKDGDTLMPGQVLITPPDHHLIVASRGKVGLKAGEPREGHMPSANLLLESAAKVYGRRAVGMLLTGMGADGADGMVAVKAAGGRTLAQNEESCVVFGMPGAAAARGAVDQLIHSDQLASTLLQLARGDGLASAR